MSCFNAAKRKQENGEKKKKLFTLRKSQKGSEAESEGYKESLRRKRKYDWTGKGMKRTNLEKKRKEEKSRENRAGSDSDGQSRTF